MLESGSPRVLLLHISKATVGRWVNRNNKMRLGLSFQKSGERKRRTPATTNCDLKEWVRVSNPARRYRNGKSERSKFAEPLVEKIGSKNKGKKTAGKCEENTHKLDKITTICSSINLVSLPETPSHSSCLPLAGDGGGNPFAANMAHKMAIPSLRFPSGNG